MFVVIVGSRDWNSEGAVAQVHRLLDELRTKYPGVIFVTSSTDKGVGKIIRERCMKDSGDYESRLEWIDVHVRVCADLNKSKLNQAFYARNAALVELGEEFHVFVEKNRKGSFEDLVDKLKKTPSPRPVILHLPEF